MMFGLTPQTLQQIRPVAALVGPTAVGKSRVGILVAKALGSDVLTADSRQVYRGMDIGMDKPTLTERQGVRHGLIDLVNPDEPFNTGMFRRAALAEIARSYEAGRLPFVVGGTGLYVRTLLHGLWEGPTADWSLRARLMAAEEARGPGYLHGELRRVDAATAARLHQRDLVKIVRALEVYQLLRRPISAMHEAHAFEERPFASLVIGLNRDRAALYRRIDARVEYQVEKGLIEETRRLLAAGFGRHLGSMKGLGYRQISGYLDGEYDREEALRRLKRDTRHFAKRQLTWFRKEQGVQWVMIEEGESPERTADRVAGMIRAFVEQAAADSASSRRTALRRDDSASIGG
jgi:tRNA dimethylallyltransferase